MDLSSFDQENEMERIPKIAGYGKRFAAVLIDSIIFWVVVVIPLKLLGVDDRDVFLPFFLAMVSYFSFFHSKYGQTPGKKIMKIRVVSEQYARPELKYIIMRESLGRFMASLVWALGYLWIFVDKRNQGWHDKIGMTLVVEE